MTSIAEAPSETCEEFPAVVEPSFLKTGLSFARPSFEVFLGPSSSETITSCSSPDFGSLTIVFTGTISSLNFPSFCAFKALKSVVLKFLFETFLEK
jgi:hypothetical protein